MKQDVYVAYYDLDTNTVELRNYETRELNECTFTQFKRFVNSSNAKVFINDVNIIAELIPDGTIDGVKMMNDESKEYIRYLVKECTLESFSVKCPSDWNPEILKQIYGSDTITDGMIEHIEHMGGLRRLSKTIASHSVKIFFSDIKDELWKDKRSKKAYINTVKEFNMLHAGCKKGCLTKPKELKKHDNVTEWDIKTAYGAAFVCDNKFPIGKQRITSDVKKFISELKKGNNVKFVCYKKIPEIEDAVRDYGLSFWDDHNKMTALELYDIIDIKRLGVDFGMIFKKYNCTYITYDETGYTNRVFANKYVDVFEEKNYYTKGTPERSFVKAQTEHVYGKAIQKRDFADDIEVVRHYRGRGENYITPQMANHASACVRHQIFQAIFDLGEDVLYFDTDGIKVKENERTRSYFERKNIELKEQMRLAGFEDTLLGTWEDEKFDEFIAVRPKIYVTRKDQEISITAAGMDDFAKNWSLHCFLDRGVQKENVISNIEKYGIPFIVKQILRKKDGTGVDVKYLEPVILTGKEDFSGKEETD